MDDWRAPARRQHGHSRIMRGGLGMFLGASLPADRNNVTVMRRFAGEVGLLGSRRSRSALPMTFEIRASGIRCSTIARRAEFARSSESSQFVRLSVPLNGSASVWPEMVILFGRRSATLATRSSKLRAFPLIRALPGSNTEESCWSLIWMRRPSSVFPILIDCLISWSSETWLIACSRCALRRRELVFFSLFCGA